MKIKLLVYCGEMLVEGLQLRKPAQDRVHELGIVLKKKKTFSMLTQLSPLQDFQISFVMNSNA